MFNKYGEEDLQSTNNNFRDQSVAGDATASCDLYPETICDGNCHHWNGFTSIDWTVSEDANISQSVPLAGWRNLPFETLGPPHRTTF